MLTIDANIWIAVFDPRDAFHTRSSDFLKAVAARGLEMTAPSFLLTEVACAVSRLTRSPAAGITAMNRLSGHPALRLVPLTAPLVARATRLGTAQFLRGADALYAATAEQESCPLITWDRELISRAGALTPADWLTANP